MIDYKYKNEVYSFKGLIEEFYFKQIAEKYPTQFTNWERPLNTFLSWDFTIDRKDVKIYIETKIRKCRWNQYDSVVIEKQKHKVLSDKDSLYINIYPLSKKAIIHKLKNIDLSFEEKSMPRNDKRANYKQKEVSYIPLNQGMVIDIDFHLPTLHDLMTQEQIEATSNDLLKELIDTLNNSI